MQVNCTPLTVSFPPIFDHFAPAFAAAKAGEVGISDKDRTIIEALNVDFANLFIRFLLSGLIRNTNFLLFPNAR
jgi:hypothetical protein